jgi:hypothetical protein
MRSTSFFPWLRATTFTHRVEINPRKHAHLSLVGRSIRSSAARTDRVGGIALNSSTRLRVYPHPKNSALRLNFSASPQGGGGHEWSWEIGESRSRKGEASMNGVSEIGESRSHKGEAGINGVGEIGESRRVAGEVSNERSE